MKLNDKIEKGNPFKVPEGYFDSLTDRTMAAIREEESRSEAGKGPGQLQKEGSRQTDWQLPGQAPGQLPGQTPGQLPGQAPGQAPLRKETRIINMKPFLALAATIIGFAVIAAVTVRLIDASQAPEGYEPGTSLYADLAFEEVDAFVLENELSSTEPVSADLTEEEISSEAIIEYLITEGIELNDIYELL